MPRMTNGCSHLFSDLIFFFNFSLLTHLKLCKDFEVDNHIKDFAAKLSLIPSPPPGPLHLVNKSGLFCLVFANSKSIMTTMVLTSYALSYVLVCLSYASQGPYRVICF